MYWVDRSTGEIVSEEITILKNTAWIRTTLDWTPYRFRLKNMTKR